MIMAISTDAGYVSEHFGRCPKFSILNIENGSLIEKKEVNNPGHEPGKIPEFLNQLGVKAIVCGGMGQRAVGFFQQYDIEVITGASGTIEDTIKKLIDNTIVSSASACTPGAGRGYGLDKEECDHEEEE